MKRDPLPQFEPGLPVEGEAVTRILRISPARAQGSAMEHLFAARRRVQGPAGVPGLCGAVLHVAGWYVLWQEGPEEAIEEALRSPVRKRRPDIPHLVHRSVGPRTLQEPLAVSITQWIEPANVFERRIEAVAAAVDLQPRDAWRLLSEPSMLAPAGEPAPAGCHVAWLASADARAVERARSLAEHLGRPLVYRRFAGSAPSSADVGTAYFDLLVGGRALRVEALTRRAFAHPLVRASMAPPALVALLAGQNAKGALDLATSLAAFLRAGPGAVPVHILEDATHATADLRQILQAPGAVVDVPADPLSDLQLVALLLGLPQRVTG